MGFILSRWMVSLMCSLPFAVFAQSYPERPVRVVVSYSAGATNDIVARLVAQRLSTAFKQNLSLIHI